MTHLNVNETFTTIQGEGRNTGQLSTFLRLSGCNLTCSWCDTPYTWDWARHDHDAETHPTTVGDLAARLDAMPGRVVVTGGEPLLQARGLAALWDLLPGRVFDLETNGTRPLGPTAGMWDTITCSPKVGPSSGQDPRIARAVHESIVDADADFKFVIANHQDLAAAYRFIAEHAIPAPRVWFMPEGATAVEILGRGEFVAAAALDAGVNVSTRLHVLTWGNTRGT